MEENMKHLSRRLLINLGIVIVGSSLAATTTSLLIKYLQARPLDALGATFIALVLIPLIYHEGIYARLQWDEWLRQQLQEIRNLEREIAEIRADTAKINKIIPFQEKIESHMSRTRALLDQSPRRMWGRLPLSLKGQVVRELMALETLAGKCPDNQVRVYTTDFVRMVYALIDPTGRISRQVH